jgi:hypothetical protein
MAELPNARAIEFHFLDCGMPASGHGRRPRVICSQYLSGPTRVDSANGPTSQSALQERLEFANGYSCRDLKPFWCSQPSSGRCVARHRESFLQPTESEWLAFLQEDGNSQSLDQSGGPWAPGDHHFCSQYLAPGLPGWPPSRRIFAGGPAGWRARGRRASSFPNRDDSRILYEIGIKRLRVPCWRFDAVAVSFFSRQRNPQLGHRRPPVTFGVAVETAGSSAGKSRLAPYMT